MRKLFGAQPVILALILFLAAGSVSAQSENSFLISQLSLLSRFAEVQSPSHTDSDTKDSEVIRGFIHTISTEMSESDSVSSDSLAAFCRHAFADSSNPAMLRALQISGRLQYTISGNPKSQAVEKPFSNHVKEAISVNKARAEFYARVSGGQSKGLSKHYTSLEYCLLPLAAIFDKWAQRLNKRGIPAMKSDFVSMSGIPAQEAAPLRKGTLDRPGVKVFGNLLHSFQQRVYAAAARKDFVQVQLAAIDALSSLKQLEVQNHCNLSLSIHFIESVGLAARNADLLGQQYDKQADNFYRAFIILQTSGLKLFAALDLKAQPFHQQGIGIITNDLPAIPFP